mmetsp:Transcript_42231/g.127601  ORF Transcript_42231/g.127601 Transcript_42231/m.127601 type:complete len:212 (-) Transcript_42231:228-863(-)
MHIWLHLLRGRAASAVRLEANKHIRKHMRELQTRARPGPRAGRAVEGVEAGGPVRRRQVLAGEQGQRRSIRPRQFVPRPLGLHPVVALRGFGVAGERAEGSVAAARVPRRGNLAVHRSLLVRAQRRSEAGHKDIFAEADGQQHQRAGVRAQRHARRPQVHVCGPLEGLAGHPVREPSPQTPPVLHRPGHGAFPAGLLEFRAEHHAKRVRQD